MKQIIFVALIAATLAAKAGVNYTNQVMITSSASQVTLTDAQYDIVPTRTEVRPIPGCNPYGEVSQDCNETVVLESEPVIRGNISYVDSMNLSEGNEKSWTSVVFKLSDFSDADVNSLKAVYPPWKHPFSNVGRKFAKNKMSLTSQVVKQPIQVVDMNKSRLCAVNGETGEKINPSCEDYIVYKESWTRVTLVSVNLK